MPPDTDWPTDLLPAASGAPSCPPGSNWQQVAEPPPLHERLRPVALALAWETAITALVLAHLLLGFLVWAVWNAR